MTKYIKRSIIPPDISILSALLILILILITTSSNAKAQFSADDILILANSKSESSLEIANYYAKKRNIPADSIVSLDCSTEEHISREEFNSTILFPLKKLISEKTNLQKKRIIVLTHGVPLGINDTYVEKEKSEPLKQELGKQAQILKNRYQMELGTLEKISKQTRRFSNPLGFTSDQMPSPIITQELIKYIEEIHRALSSSSQSDKATLSRDLRSVIERLFGLRGVLSTLIKPDSSPDPDKDPAIVSIRNELIEISKTSLPDSESSLVKHLALLERGGGIIGVISQIPLLADSLFSEQSGASVDSELSVLHIMPGGAPISFRLPNPLFMESKDSKGLQSAPLVTFPLLLTSRLDGPGVNTVKKIIDNTLTADNLDNLKGTFLIDARGLSWEQRDEYATWDRDITTLARVAKTGSRFKIDFDGRPEIAGETKNIALYIGWYQVRKYENVYSFKPGAVGYHIASSEAISVRNPDETGWVKNLLERGVVSTIGAVNEPYLDSFPKPTRFFDLLLSGKYQLIEVYALSSPYISWRLVLFGDPLYQPISEHSAKDELGYRARQIEKLPERPSRFLPSAHSLINSNSGSTTESNGNGTTPPALLVR
ncbi:MAG TPA: TIGR03790 family protein [Oligoflexia bacterium]|nr:TIGR03790 family protein [Oligoflexia bacterium]HMP49625.1 TIGR03790 family protein [Oligoflexia bacterium]